MTPAVQRSNSVVVLAERGQRRYRLHRVVAAAPETVSTVVDAVLRFLASPWVAARDAYWAPGHRNRGDALLAAVLAFSAAAVEAPLPLLARTLEAALRFQRGLLWAALCCGLCGGLREDAMLDAKVVLADEAPQDDPPLAPDRAADLIDAAALGARVRDALGAGARRDAVSANDARRALATLLECDGHLVLDAATDLAADVEAGRPSRGASRASLLSRPSLRESWDPAGVRRHWARRSLRDWLGGREVGAVDHDALAAALLEKWSWAEPEGWVSVVPFCLRVADLYHSSRPSEAFLDAYAWSEGSPERTSSVVASPLRG